MNRQNPMGRLNVDPEAASHAIGQEAVIGRRVPMTVEGAARIPKPTQLISARFPNPMEWVITVMQPVRIREGVNPWASPFDGGMVAPGASFTAPVMPSGAGGESSMQMHMRWGAGGAAWETRFDYPICGTSFGIVADMLDLNVEQKVVTVNGYASDDLVPVIGAFMVPGRASDPHPLRWLENPFNGPIDASPAGVFYAIKPYARWLNVTLPAQTVAYQLEFFNAAGAVLWTERFPQTAGLVGMTGRHRVPAQAAFVKITNGDGAPRAIGAEWEIGLV